VADVRETKRSAQRVAHSVTRSGRVRRFVLCGQTGGIQRAHSSSGRCRRIRFVFRGQTAGDAAGGKLRCSAGASAAGSALVAFGAVANVRIRADLVADTSSAGVAVLEAIVGARLGSGVKSGGVCGASSGGRGGSRGGGSGRGISGRSGKPEAATAAPCPALPVRIGVPPALLAEFGKTPRK
jgi:hypothetical protein